MPPYEFLRAFSTLKKFGNFLLGISVWEERIPFVTKPIRSQAPRSRFTKRLDASVNCYPIFSNMSFVAFPPNKCLLSAYVVMRSLTSASSHLFKFTVVETSPVNEELQKNFSELIMQHFTRETCIAKESFKQARISTYHLYTRHIRAAINFLDLALELCRHRTRSSPLSSSTT